MRVASTGMDVVEFSEDPTLAAGWVSGGFFVFERVFLVRYLDDDPGKVLPRDGQLSNYPHESLWMGMDTHRDWTEFNTLWDSGAAP